MTLTLTIQDMDRLSNGLPAEFVLARRGAKIGRSPTSDWCLPDPNKYISSTHCMLRFEGGFYWLEDLSTNGTFLNGEDARMNGRRRIEHGDRFLIGPYVLVASLSGEAVEAFNEEQAEHEARAEGERWQGWGNVYDGPGQGAPAPGAPAPPSGARGPEYVQPFGEGWTPSQRSPDPPRHSVWSEQKIDRMEASGWSSEAGPAAAARPGDAWGELAQSYVVDWARGGFNQPSTANPDPLGLGKGEARSDPFSIPLGPEQEAARGNAPAPDPQSFGAPPPPSPPSRAAEAPPSGAAPSAANEAALAATLAQAMHIDPDALGLGAQDLAQRTGMLMHRLVAGMTMMIEARARAKQQLGAEGTSFSYDDNNPLKFARNTEDALGQLLKDPERGFMDGLRAVEDAFQDLQAHQMATLKAMQGALKATLERFSPDAIRKRADGSGILKIIPGTRDAALWKAYEKEFSGVAEGSDEAFMDVFAKEFRKAYMDSTR